MNRFHSPESLPEPKGYSHIAEATGSRIVHISGQLPLLPDRTLVGEGDFGAQVRQAFSNLGLALEAAGATWSDVVKLGIFVTSLDGLAELRAIRESVVDPERPPASTLVQVAGLAQPGAMVEIEAVAILD
jgi:enamine deaminase RidA (YjgF/YER057c/UK114 family)